MDIYFHIGTSSCQPVYAYEPVCVHEPDMYDCFSMSFNATLVCIERIHNLHHSHLNRLSTVVLANLRPKGKANESSAIRSWDPWRSPDESAHVRRDKGVERGWAWDPGWVVWIKATARFREKATACLKHKTRICWIFTRTALQCLRIDSAESRNVTFVKKTHRRGEGLQHLASVPVASASSELSTTPVCKRSGVPASPKIKSDLVVEHLRIEVLIYYINKTLVNID